jgi:hypothetical protein
MSELVFRKSAVSPSTPGAGEVTFFVKADGKLYYKDETNLELPVSSNKTIFMGNIPPVSNVGDLWLDTSTTPPKLKIYNGSNWQFIGNSILPEYSANDANKVLSINESGTGLTFTNPVTPTTAFTSLTDVPSSYTGMTNKVVSVNSTGTGLTFTSPITSFVALTDTPDTYTGMANKVVSVNSTGTGLTFTNPVTPSTAFTSLTDAPTSYVGMANKVVSVNASGTGLTFTNPVTPITTFTTLSDTPDTYTGMANKVVSVNASATGLTFTDLASSTVQKFEFIVVFGASNPSSITNIPSGWSSNINSSDITIIHTIGRPPASIHYHGLGTLNGQATWRYRLPTAANEMSIPDINKNSEFTFRINTSIAGADASSIARIVVLF